jgi:RimJ/RimL family protein N-acetyltransferase
MNAFFAPERLATPDFVLRSYLPGDGPATAEAKRGSFAHLSSWMPWASETETDDGNEVMVRRNRAQYLTNTDYTVGIWSPDEQRLRGGTGLHLRGRSIADGAGEVGMWIRAEDAGEGLGTAALQAILRWGFTEWPFKRLSWHCDADNIPSRRVAEKAGMRLEGELRGDKSDVSDARRTTLIFGLTREELPALL